MKSAIRLSIIGAVGGLIVWFLSELLFGNSLLERLPQFQKFVLYAAYGAVSGFTFGLILGISHLILLRHWWLPLISMTLGLIGGVFGLLWGEAMYQVLKFAELPARVIGWGIVGFALGSSQGAARGSMVGALRAGLGGGIGGMVGGVLFTLLPSILHFPDSVCRGIAWVLMGLLIGATSVLFERLLAGAVLKIASGKMEGKEFILDKSYLVIGRDERCDIPIYYDPAIQPKHATLEWTGAGYRIAPIGNAQVIVNGQSVPIKELNHNDVVIIGNTRLVYRLRAGPSTIYLCASCYAPNRKSAKFCHNCGKPFVPLDLPKEPVGRWLLQTLVALGVFLLCVGISYGLGNWVAQARSFTTVIKSPQPGGIAKQWEQRPLRLAVTPAGYDDIGSVLRIMGFQPTEVSLNNLPMYLAEADCLFINCAGNLRFQIVRQILAPSIRTFVLQGGTLYASDFAALLLEDAFPEAFKAWRANSLDPESVGGGNAETVTASVVDSALRDYLQADQISIHFDQSGWYGVRWLTPTGLVYLQDTFTLLHGFGVGGSGEHTSGEIILPLEQREVVLPLVVSFNLGQGLVVYTAFHNKAQPSEMERRLIEFLAIRPLTARLSRQIAQEIARPVEVGTLGEREATGLLTGRQMVMQREIIGTLETAQSSPVYRFQLSQPSPVKIVVGWEGGIGEFILTLWSETAPQRRWRQFAQSPPLILTVTEPLPAGSYCLQLTATKAPLPKTPFVIGIGLAQ